MDDHYAIKLLVKDTFSNPSKDNAIELYHNLERFINDGSPSGYAPVVESEFDPLNNKLHHVDISYTTDKRRNCINFGEISGFFDGLVDEDCTVRIYHPKLSKGFNKSETKILAIPTASVRTLFNLNPSNPFFVKFHFPWLVGRFKREMPLYKWMASLERSREIELSLSIIPEYTGVLLERAGIFYNGLEEVEDHGVIFRDFDRFPIQKENTILLPSFSLFSARYPNSSLLRDVLSQLGFSYKEALEHFVYKLIDSYFFYAGELGLIPELNAQNVLYEICPYTKSVRVIIRDFEDFFVDLNIRKSNSLHLCFSSYKCIDENSYDLFKRRSFAFDFKMGEYLILPLATTIAECFDVDIKIVLEQVRAYTNRDSRKKWVAEYFNGDYWYSYPNELTVDRSSYLKNDFPKFR